MAWDSSVVGRDAMKLLGDDFLGDVLNSVADPVFVKDGKHRFVWVNQAFCTYTGLAREEVLGKSDYEFFPKEEADEFLRKDMEVLITGIENINEEKITLPDGKTTATIVTRKRLYIDRQGERFIVGVSRDISEIKVARENLLKINEGLDLVVSGEDSDLRIMRRA